MAKYVNFRDGGKTDEHGISRPFRKLAAGNVFTGLETTQQSPVALGVTVSAGDLMIDSGNGYPYIGWSDASTNVTISTADGSNPRIDLIVAYIDLSVVSSATPNNPGALAIIKVTGTPAGSPVEPNAAAIQSAVGGSNPYTILAKVTVGTGVTSITNSNIVDRRTLVTSSIPSSEIQSGGYTALSYTPSAVSYSGQHSYDLTFNTDLTATLAPGMRIRTTRNTAAPVQSASLNGSTHYFNKTSPAGTTFTDDFVVSAWIKISAYSSVSGGIATRYNGTSGFVFDVNATGQVRMIGYNGGSSNYSLVQSYQSVPLNKWIHVVAQLDMSSFTATSTTSYIMMDGVDIPAQLSRAGTNPTALTQAGNLEIGSSNSGINLFNGKISQVAIYSAKVTQANVRATVSQTLSGSETSIVSAYSLSNSTSDLNVSNANNLTAQNSATTTNADSPFGGQANGTISSTLGYGIITKTTSTTITVQVPEGCTIPTSGTVSSVHYSSQKAPYGMPIQRGKWQVLMFQVVTETGIAIGATNSWTAAHSQLNVPIGSWQLSYSLNIQLHSSANGGRLGFVGLDNSTYNPLTSSYYGTPLISQVPYSANNTDAIGSMYNSYSFDLAAASTFTTKVAITGASGTESFITNYNSSNSTIIAECAYL